MDFMPPAAETQHTSPRVGRFVLGTIVVAGLLVGAASLLSRPAPSVPAQPLAGVHR